jgi:hypothetical protein
MTQRVVPIRTGITENSATAQDLYDALHSVIDLPAYDHVSISVVIGVLEMVKFDHLSQSRN